MIHIHNNRVNTFFEQNGFGPDNAQDLTEWPLPITGSVRSSKQPRTASMKARTLRTEF
jgi:hypothetical protein